MSPSGIVLRAALSLVSTLALLASARQAVAASPAATPFSPIDLAQRSLTVEAGLGDLDAEEVYLLDGAPQKIPGCALSIHDAELSGDCAFIWDNPSPGPLDLELRSGEARALLRLVPSWTSGGRVELDPGDRALVFPAGFPSGAVTLLSFDPSSATARWVERDPTNGRLALDGPTFEAAYRESGRFTIFTERGGRVLAYQVLPATRAQQQPAPSLATAPLDAGASAAELIDTHGSTDRGRWSVRVPEELSCPPKDLPHKDMIVVCVDATSDTLRYHMVPEGTRLTKPNRYFYIHVLHFVDRRVEINLGGRIGSWVPGTRGDRRFRSGGAKGGGIGGAQVAAPDLTVSTQVLAPRQPGYAPLSVRLGDLAGHAIGAPLQVEFWIEETYSGAFRMGVAGVFLGGVEQSYQKITQPNSQQAEIQASGENPIDLDLVIGYAPYLDAGGRAATGCESAPFCFSPYFGLGIASASEDGSLEFLKSVHLGAEWELTPTFSIGLTANLRRVKRLASGYHPGMPIAGEVPTEDRYVLGAGLVINLSPAFFKIGAAGAAALLQ